MKKLFLIFTLFLSIRAIAQTSTVIVITNNPSIVNITNIFPVTVVNGGESSYKEVHYITSNIINFADGEYLGATLIGNTSFILTKFPTNTFQGIFYYTNPGRYKLDFQSALPIKWMNGSAPTNNVDGCILFEFVFDQLRATQ